MKKLLVLAITMMLVVGMTGLVFAQGPPDRDGDIPEVKGEVAPEAENPTEKAQEVLSEDGEAELINNINEEGLENKNVHIQNTVSDPGNPDTGE